MTDLHQRVTPPAQREPRWRRVPVLRDPVPLLFFAAALISAIYLLVLGRHLSFMFDDWGFLIDRPGWSAQSLLDPHNEHIVVFSVAVYKLLLATVGMDSAFPFQVVSTLVFLCSVALLFIYLRRRVDDWLALAGAILILFLGAAYEDLLWPFQIGFFGSMAAGLGMLLALERRDRKGDLLACALLTASTGFSSLGLPFAAGALVEIGSKRDRWRRAYVVAIPVLLYAVWWLGWGHTAESYLSWTNFTRAPLHVVDGLAAGVSSLLGLSLLVSPPVPGGVPVSPGMEPLEWGRPLLVVAVGLAGWRIYRLGRVPQQFWVVAAVAFTFWVLAALSRGDAVGVVSRYQYMGAIFILLIAAELLRGIRIRGIGWILLAASTALIALSGAGLLNTASKNYRAAGEIGRADLAALEIARGQVKPGFDLCNPRPDGFCDPSLAGTVIPVTAGPYFKRIDDFGSPAYTVEELLSSSEQARQAADRVLAAALGLRLDPLQAFPSPGGPAPVLLGPAAAMLGESTGCLTVQAAEQNAPLLEAPTGGVVLKARGASHAQVRLRRFSSQERPIDLGLSSEVRPIDLGTLSSGQIAQIAIPADRASETWKLSLHGSGPLTVCGLGR